MPAAPRTGCGRVGVPQAMFASLSGHFVLRGHAPRLREHGLRLPRAPEAMPPFEARLRRGVPVLSNSCITSPIDTAVQLAPGVCLEVPASHNDRIIVRATQRYVA
ncbi:hypothetical protein AURDEDRAFT_117908 [Auricularia subglabra TFB-10046 SS5]|uniref:Uncharacterized protein n=1 Tax=Auricularia subglabra (strain TFB-10046 / SS5) TaxID=717982 RepID=J0WN60_AURST|nr:hypothetical protein AURDEDRAFT_117908 [Auricularia subglabra TFB-10046 SS5]